MSQSRETDEFLDALGEILIAFATQHERLVEQHKMLNQSLTMLTNIVGSVVDRVRELENRQAGGVEL